MHSMREKKPLIRVHRIPAMRNYWGAPFKRPLSSTVLRETLEKYLSRPKNALVSSLEELTQCSLTPETLETVTAALFQEGDYAYVFRVTVAAERKRVRLAMIVAKSQGGMSRAAEAEHDNLKRLFGRCRDAVVQPFKGASVTVPGKNPASVYLYFTLWLNRFHELGVQHKTMNFYVNELPFQYFDSRATDRIKGRMLCILFRLYDPIHREAIEPPKVGAGDFVVTRKAPAEVKLIACRKMLTGVSLEGCLELYLGYQGTWGDRLFHFVPKETESLRQALIDSLLIHHGFGAEEVFAALKRYRDRLARLRPRPGEWTPLPALNKLLSQKLA